jgi:DNA replication protein DnaC
MEDLSTILSDMKLHGMRVPDEKISISIDNAKEILTNALRYFISLENRESVWLPEYEEVADWLNDNHERGLFLYGNCGRGKTVLARYVIPAILLKYDRKVVNCFDAQEMNTNLDEVLKKKIVCIDDIGTEEVSVSYGNKRLAFLEVVDAAEKHGKLLIITSNLNQDQLVQKYGDRTMDRVISTTKRVLFKGKSLRR